MTKLASPVSAELAASLRGAVMKLSRRLRRVIATLEERGFIERQRNPDDGRQTVLTTTQAGRDIVRAERERRQEWLAHMIDSLADAPGRMAKLDRIGVGAPAVAVGERGVQGLDLAGIAAAGKAHDLSRG